MIATNLSPLSAAPGLVTPSALDPADRFRGRALRPPRGLYIPQGIPSSVRFGDRLPPKGGHTVVQRLGLAYEQKVQDVLREIYGDLFFCNVPILYEDRRGVHRCIPDGVLRISSTSIVIIEIKLRHTERAWWQLERLYLPVIRSMIGSEPLVYRVEICRSYDPDEKFGAHKLVTSLHKLPQDVGVIQWKI